MTARGCSQLCPTLFAVAACSVIAAVPSCGGQVEERALADASVGDHVDSGSDAGTSCRGIFPTLPVACSDAAPSETCAFILHRRDCCGNESAYPVQGSRLEEAQRAEDEWRRNCPLCGCKPNAAPNVNGFPCTASRIRAACVDIFDICEERCE
jgi:hypothetical protein